MSEITEQPRPAGRPCRVCSSPNRAAIEEQLVAPTRNLSQIARDWSDISEDSLRRHWASHVAPQVREAMEQATVGLSPLTIAARLTDLMQATEDIRTRAMESGRDHVALRAIEIERGLTITLADRLGIRATMALDELEFAITVKKAMARLAYRDGESGEALAAVFESMGERHIAADIRTMFPETRKAIA